MSPDRQPKSPQAVVRYLRTVLMRNPLTEAKDIVYRREVALGIRKRNEADAAEAQQSDQERLAQRNQIKERLDRIRDEFWTTSPDELFAAISAIDVARFPELKLAHDRISHMVSIHGQFEAIHGLKGKCMNFWNTLRRVLISPPSQAGQVKTRYLQRFRHSDDFVRAQKTARMIRKRHPLIYNLETDWIDEICKHR